MTNVSKNFTGQSLRIWRINSHHLIVTRLTRWLYHILITIRGQMVHKRPDKESKHGRDMLCVTRPASSSHNTNPILPGPGLVVLVPPCQAPGSPRPPAKVPHFQFSHQTTSRGQSRVVAGTWPSPSLLWQLHQGTWHSAFWTWTAILSRYNWYLLTARYLIQFAKSCSLSKYNLKTIDHIRCSVTIITKL